MIYASNPEWIDIEKIPQEDGPDPVVPIAYSAKFRDVMDCFRGVLRVNEHSLRTLALTEDVINANPANYTAWYFRRQILDTLSLSLYKELEITEQMAIEHPKNYQVWHHRREICSKLGDGSLETKFCSNALQYDHKNYHAWAHRQWAVKKFQLWNEELEYIERMLEEDVRNNSAWNHRWFIVQNNDNVAMTLDNDSILQREMNFAFEKLEKARRNESCWNYLRGLHEFTCSQMVDTRSCDLAQILREKCLEILKQDAENIYSCALLVDLYENEKTKPSLEVAKKLMESLMNELDIVRRPYWQFRVQLVEEQLEL
uniref:Protein farnesyltransferase/geranylgeranyltransferase type-1 subunit alpha n=1 Tax=Albugo laibachii Nc14 TaxID=890382 RepID=F0W510_9STRA|nr:protein farnesyltransferase/geranylgeranyltransferase putative [Albugo laibachii Nc14]|eukprot:CCA16201.1 protein farnesyltransferase/geranylgeranyltransferase putative [Albugo laibachii Nc14]